MEAEYLTLARTAALLRHRLRREFPRVKFSVRSRSYAGGASVDVNWTDGPGMDRVDEVARMYAAADFDASIDMQVRASHWLLPDGTTQVAFSPGTVGAGGHIPRIESCAPHRDAKLVRFYSDYVHTHRKYSPTMYTRVLRHLEERYGVELECVDSGAERLIRAPGGVVGALFSVVACESWNTLARRELVNRNGPLEPEDDEDDSPAPH